MKVLGCRILAVNTEAEIRFVKGACSCKGWDDYHNRGRFSVNVHPFFSFYGVY